MSIGQLLTCEDHHEQERHDELISIMLTIFFKSR